MESGRDEEDVLLIHKGSDATKTIEDVRYMSWRYLRMFAALFVAGGRAWRQADDS